MNLNKKQISEALEWWGKLIDARMLPDWDALPEFELYMDQVVSFIEKNLKAYSIEKLITSSMINNYVKNRIIPPPVKKKYNKKHLAYLIMICFFKQTLSIATIQKIAPYDMSDEQVKTLYNSFVKNQNTAFRYVTQQIRNVADPIIESAQPEPERTSDFSMQVSISANIFKHITEKLASLMNEE
ncbi:MAG: DUF1836 domain-containing protein [Eubacteriales bacterium]|nr:DUF1836 domain-containing protein [Eubacteriales bacterium]